MNRGSLPKRHRKRVSNRCFNEAPIHESGKYGAPVASRSGSKHRFNEAPIHESGKYNCFKH